MFHVTVSTKGGVGKSTLSQQVIAPFLFYKNEKKVRIIEVDDNNDSSKILGDSKVTFIDSLKVERGNDEAQSALFNVYDGEDVIIDAGGSGDTIEVIKSISSLGVYDKCIFYIPLLKNKAGVKNALDAYNIIRAENKESKVIFILNQAKSMHNDEVKDQFVYFFGDRMMGIDGIADIFKEDKNVDVISVPDTNVFDYSETYGMTAYEIGNETIDRDTFFSEQKEKSAEAFQKALAFNKVYTKCKAFKEMSLDRIFEELLKAV